MKNGKMNLQRFSEGNGGSAGTTGDGNQGENAGYTYEQLEEIAGARAEKAEKAAIAGYLRNKGMSEDDITTAIADFKEKQNANKPNVTAITKERDDALAEAAQLKQEKLLTQKGVSNEDLEYFVDEYVEMFYNYYNDLMSTDTSKVDAALKALNDAKEKLVSAQNDVTTASKEVQEKSELVSNLEKQKSDANEAITEAQKKIENANASNEEKNKLIAEAQKKVDAANTKYNNAIADVTIKKETMDSAYNTLDDKAILLMQSERAKQEDETAVNSIAGELHAAGQELIKDENIAKQNYEAAIAKYKEIDTVTTNLMLSIHEQEEALPGKQEDVAAKEQKVTDTKTVFDVAEKNYQDVLATLGNEVVEAEKIKTQKENELNRACKRK